MPTFADVRELLAGKRLVRRVPFPGLPDVEVGVRMLSDRELDEARLEAQRYIERRVARVGLKRTEFVEVDPEALERAIEQELVFRVFVDPDSDERRPFFATPDDVRALDTVTVRALLDLYLDHQETVSPRVTLSAADVEEVIDALGKAPEPQVILAHYAPETLRLLLRSMVFRLSTSPTGKSSTGRSS